MVNIREIGENSFGETCMAYRRPDYRPPNIYHIGQKIKIDMPMVVYVAVKLLPNAGLYNLFKNYKSLLELGGVVDKLQKIFGTGSRGVKWKIVSDIPEEMRITTQLAR